MHVGFDCVCNLNKMRSVKKAKVWGCQILNYIDVPNGIIRALDGKLKSV